MPENKEQEIRLQFLEEAQEYLNIIEAAILGLATAEISSRDMDALLRAAHSIKGGAAMMGFETMSHLSHRLEDFFKVLKLQQHSLDADLETLLLAGVDCLRQLIVLNRQGTDADEQWLDSYVNPVFDHLYQRLGQPAPGNATMLLPEDGQEGMIAMIFETEVEGCLQRLESILAHPEQPCLLEEVSIMAQELGGLGEMLQLNAFTKLCESIIQHLEANPDRFSEIAKSALQSWRRSQALIAVGQVAQLPEQIDFVNNIAPATVAVAPKADIADELSAVPTENPSVTSCPLPVATSDLLSEFKLESSPFTDLKENQENTVRVPIKQLDQINDLFGEQTIQRHGIDLHLGRLRNLVRILSSRVRVLRQSHTHFQSAYSKAINNAADSAVAPLTEPRPQVYQSREFSYEDALASMETNSNGFANRTENLYSAGLHEIDGLSDLHSLSDKLLEAIVRIQEVTDDVDLTLEDTDQTVGELNRTAKQLQTSLTQVRMRPLSDLVSRFPRALRELSIQYGKKVELKIHGGNTLIDRTILEALSDPLMHLLRNAFAHGIEDPATRQAHGKPEQGIIEIKAAIKGTQTKITVSDDGGGIDLGKIRQQAMNLGLDAAAIAAASDEELLTLIFEPGFSTADRVTPLSGRGVGMDVVRTNLRQIRGDIKVATHLGVGTTFTLSVPLTLSVARVLLAESNGMLAAFPTDTIEEMLLLTPEQIFTVAGNEVFSWEGYMAPLIRFNRWLKFKCPRVAVNSETTPMTSAPTVLIISQGEDLVALQVDRCWGEVEVAIRQVEGTLAMPPGFTGCTILGDGRVVPLVNVPDLLHWIASYKHSYTLEPEDQPPTHTSGQTQKDTILVVDDSVNVRRFLSLTLEKAGYRVEQAKDGQDALEKLLGGLQVQAVICDIDMPGLDGYGLLARLKPNPAFKQLPIVMLTSRNGSKDRQLAMNLGATAYFSKPYNEQDLLQTLKQLI